MSRVVRRAVMAASRRRAAVVPGAFRANLLLNNGQSATSATVSGTISGTAAALDVVLVEFETTSDAITVTTAPSGWTLLSGPTSDTVGNSWLYGKELVSGDIGAAVSWTLSSGTARCAGHGAIYSGVSWAGRQVAVLTQSALTSSHVVPTIASVTAGSIFHAGFTRVRGTPATDLTPPGGYSQGASERSATAFGTGSDVSVEAMYKVASTAGSYGGETATGGSTSRGTTYAVALPPV